MKITLFVVENFEKLTHSYTKICREKGVIDIIPVRLILMPMFVARPYTHFCTKYTPLGSLWSSLYLPPLKKKENKINIFPVAIELNIKLEFQITFIPF